MTLRLPGYEWWPLAGVPGIPYDEWDDPKALAHTTEGTSIDGAVSAYRSYPPHLIVDPWKRRKVQHVDMDRAAYALWNADADDSRCFQVEIVGFAAQTHTWPDSALQWLGEEVARPLHEYCGVPYTVVWKGFRRDGEMPYALADARSPLRLTQFELDSFSGWLGHQHIPGDSHWDPGGLNVARILEHAQEGDMSEQAEQNIARILEILESANHGATVETGLQNIGQYFREIHDEIGSMHRGNFRGVREGATVGDLSWLDDKLREAVQPIMIALAGLSDDEAKIIAAVRAQPTGGQVDVSKLAANLSAVLGSDIAATLGRRLIRSDSDS